MVYIVCFGTTRISCSNMVLKIEFAYGDGERSDCKVRTMRRRRSHDRRNDPRKDAGVAVVSESG